jgi:hypothetical protein
MHFLPLRFAVWEAPLPLCTAYDETISLLLSLCKKETMLACQEYTNPFRFLLVPRNTGEKRKKIFIGRCQKKTVDHNTKKAASKNRKISAAAP